MDSILFGHRSGWVLQQNVTLCGSFALCSACGKARWIGFGGSVDLETDTFDLGLGFRGDPDLRSGVSHHCETFGTSGPLTAEPSFDIAALEVWAPIRLEKCEDALPKRKR